MSTGFDVELPLLAKVPPMFEEMADTAERCRVYAEDVYAVMDRGRDCCATQTPGSSTS
jgi:hypothetical protein